MGIHEYEHEQQLHNQTLETHKEDEADTDVAAVSADRLAKAALKEYPPYACNKQGARIRHAMTGSWYDHAVGSNDEYRYFKVHDATSNNKYGCGNVYFFDSAEDYEKYGGEPTSLASSTWLKRRHEKFGY